MPPSRRLLIRPTDNRLNPSLSIELPWRSVRASQFFLLFLLYDSDGGRVEDTQDLAAIKQVKRVVPQCGSSQELRCEKTDIQWIAENR